MTTELAPHTRSGGGPEPHSFGAFAQWGARTLGKGMVPGLAAGVLVGGVGSRLAMRVLASTSPSARGLTTDFGATVGEITSGGTVFLLILGGVVGLMAGIVYAALGHLLPGSGWIKGLAFGVVLLAVGGTFLVSPDNPDFIILAPAGLAVAMFTALPILFGLLFVPLAERLEPLIDHVRRPALLAVPVGLGLILLAPAAGFGLAAIAGSLGAWRLRDRIDAPRERLLRVMGTSLVGALMIWRGAVYLSGVAEIL